MKRAAAGAPDSPRLGLAASINVMATAATAPILRTIGIMTPTVIAAVSRTTPGGDDNIHVPMAGEVGMRTPVDGPIG
jgi:hypothetical protein